VALIRRLEFKSLVGMGVHSEVDCSFSLVVNEDGKKCLQIDTYGSASRKLRGKKSQSVRFTPEALQQLKTIISDNEL